ncbi:MAG TPA: trypsin-like peptidase domain-containing protein [Urbifossiella sp.]|jgi:S1-C subfamily serine protease
MIKKVAAVVMCGGCAVLGGAGAQFLVRNPTPAAAHSPPLPPVQQISAEGEQPNVATVSERFQTVVKKVGPAVVSVDAVKPANIAGKSKEESGSGVMVRIPGVGGTIVVTNNHVVGEANHDKVYITLSDGLILQPKRVLADPESDISLLHLNEELPTAELGDSDRVVRGQYVLAFGSPFGLNQTVTHGIISATDRGQISLGSTIRIKEFIQTDAAINPGSSGGPLVDLDGKVVGINTAIASQSGNNTGVSFSIPANLVKRVAGQLFDKGRITRGYLGVQLATTIEPAEALRLGLTRVCGGLVEIVHPGTPAEAAGLKTGDVILKLEDVDLRDENHLINLVSALPPHQRVKLVVWRDRKAHNLEVAIGDWSVTRTKR